MISQRLSDHTHFPPLPPPSPPSQGCILSCAATPHPYPHLSQVHEIARKPGPVNLGPLPQQAQRTFGDCELARCASLRPCSHHAHRKASKGRFNKPGCSPACPPPRYTSSARASCPNIRTTTMIPREAHPIRRSHRNRGTMSG